MKSNRAGNPRIPRGGSLYLLRVIAKNSATLNPCVENREMMLATHHATLATQGAHPCAPVRRMRRTRLRLDVRAPPNKKAAQMAAFVFSA